MAGEFTLPGVLLTGTHSGRPAASAVANGALYAETDTGQTYQSDGSSTWTAWGALAGGGIVQQATAKRTAGDLTTTGTAFADLTSMTVTLTTGAHRCLVFFNANAKNNNSSGNTAFDIAVDGTLQGGTYGLGIYAAASGGSSAAGMISLAYMTAVLSAGSHTIKIQWRVDFGTGTCFASSSVTPAILTVVETSLTT